MGTFQGLNWDDEEDDPELSLFNRFTLLVRYNGRALSCELLSLLLFVMKSLSVSSLSSLTVTLLCKFNDDGISDLWICSPVSTFSVELSVGCSGELLLSFRVCLAIISATINNNCK